MENVYHTAVALKVYNGTLRSDSNLCATCRFCVRRESSVSGRTSTICEANYNRPFVLTEPVGRCNRYLDSSRLSLNEMLEIAWVVESRGKHVGFLSPEELAKRRGGQGIQASPGIGF